MGPQHDSNECGVWSQLICLLYVQRFIRHSSEGVTWLVLNPITPSKHAHCKFFYSSKRAGSQEVTHSSDEERVRL